MSILGLVAGEVAVQVVLNAGELLIAGTLKSTSSIVLIGAVHIG
jgi:hypothetical protein